VGHATPTSRLRNSPLLSTRSSSPGRTGRGQAQLVKAGAQDAARGRELVLDQQAQRESQR